MTRRNRNWLILISLVIGVGALAGTALVVAAHRFANRIEPYIREQAILYLQRRFDSEVEVAALRISLPHFSQVKLLLNRGRGIKARVEGEGVSLRHKGRHDVPPLFVMEKFTCDLDLGTLFDTPKTVPSVTIEGMKINIPPKGERPDFHNGEDSGPDTGVIIQEVLITDSSLSILPKEKNKVPLRFDLHRVRLESAGKNVAMDYEAEITNAKPPGEIRSNGKFGPWAADEPGDTPLAGNYEFNQADLGVFDGIAGILDSTGQFEGRLNAIEVQGRASVPDFRLKISGNRVPLTTRFQVLVDGTNGNTILKPVNGTLGKTNFTTSGGVVKHEKEDHRGISLDVDMPKGNLKDLLTLAMKGPSFMEGQIFLKTKINIPPLTGKVKDKLILDGRFDISNGKFLQSKIQDQIDTLSRRGQGQPKNEAIDEVVSGMGGSFHLEDKVITFSALSFAVPGAGVDLTGNYDLDKEVLEFHGALKLDAKVSQTMTGWKRWALKPVDPFFSKNGAGTFLRIKVDGTAKEPKFGLDRGKKEQDNAGFNKKN
jgi:hypothetical protein